MLRTICRFAIPLAVLSAGCNKSDAPVLHAPAPNAEANPLESAISDRDPDGVMPPQGTVTNENGEPTNKTSATRAEQHKQHTERLLGIIRKQITILRTIQNVDTAESAVPDLQAVMNEMTAITGEMKAFGEVTPEENALLTTDLGTQITSASKSLSEEFNRVLADKDIARVLEAVRPAATAEN